MKPEENTICKHKQLAITYKIFDPPDNFGEEKYLPLIPIVFIKQDGGDVEKISAYRELQMDISPKTTNEVFSNNNDFHRIIKRKYRENQERIIADIICGIIIDKLRENPAYHLTLFITAKFETAKIMGRLAYLNLPTDRITILFVSRRISDFFTRYIVPDFDYQYDINYLLSLGDDKTIYGPFPSNDAISLTRTFYKAYRNTEFYPLKVELFLQNFDNKKIIKIKEQIDKQYLSISNTCEALMSELPEKMITRMPRILWECEEYKEKIYDKPRK